MGIGGNVSITFYNFQIDSCSGQKTVFFIFKNDVVTGHTVIADN